VFKITSEPGTVISLFTSAVIKILVGINGVIVDKLACKRLENSVMCFFNFGGRII